MKLLDAKLNQLLVSVKVPCRSPEYWENFPKQVVSALVGTERRGVRAPETVRVAWRSSPIVWWGAGIATTCLVIGIGLWCLRVHRPVPMDYAKMYREIEGLFPNQIEAIIADQHGVRIKLADKPGVPASQPLLVEACGPAGCRTVITFSGQEININGSTWDVLLNAQNQVIVAGATTEQYQIIGQKLMGNL